MDIRTEVGLNLIGGEDRTSGSFSTLMLTGDWAPLLQSTMEGIGVNIRPTINYQAGTPGAGRIQLLRLAPTNTALPTGNSGAIVLSSAASALGGVQAYNTTDETTNYERLKIAFASNVLNIVTEKGGTGTVRGINIAAAAGSLGFYGATPVALQTGVAVSAAGIHAALVNLGLITA